MATSSWGLTTPGVAAPVEEPFTIPTGYGDDRIVLMVKDPWWLYAYWEVQPATERAARAQLTPHEIAGLRSVLRVSDVTDADVPQGAAHQTCDIPLSGLATNWFIHTNAPNREFIVDLGLLTAGGRFLLLVRSNRVRAPRAAPSEIIDPDWPVTDELYLKLGGLRDVGMGASPFLWSGDRSSAGHLGPSRASLLQGFWCRVNADLIIHGITEPRATVTIDGQPVSVRKDGSFSLRLALPEGSHPVTIVATSPDGRESKTLAATSTLVWSGAFSADTGSPLPQQQRAESTRAGAR